MASDAQHEGADTEMQTDEGGTGAGAGPGVADELERELNFQVSAACGLSPPRSTAEIEPTICA